MVNGKCSGSFDLNTTGSYEECSDSCKFEYKYEFDNTSQCKITKKRQYLNIVSWDRSKVVIGQDECVLNEMRLYSPSVNKYDGKLYDGELILRHVANGINYYVCIPLKISGSAGNGKEFFDSLDSGVKVLPNQNSVRVDLGRMFNLDSLIPKSTFYYSEGDSMDFDGNCLTSSSRIILFPVAKNCSKNFINNVRKIARNTNSGIRRRTVNGSASFIYDNNQQETGKFLINKEGTKTKDGSGGDSGASYDIVCDPVVDTATGKNVLGGKEESKYMTGEFVNVDKGKIMMYVWMAVGVILSFLGIFLFWRYILSKPLPHPDPIKAQAGKMTSRFGDYVWRQMHKTVKTA